MLEKKKQITVNYPYKELLVKKLIFIPHWVTYKRILLYQLELSL